MRPGCRLRSPIHSGRGTGSRLQSPRPRLLSPRRLLKALALRAILWTAILLGILFLHSGEILLFLVVAYFIAFSIVQRLALDLVRFRTRSPAAAAIFGAILLAAFALAIFPVA